MIRRPLRRAKNRISVGRDGQRRAVDARVVGALDEGATDTINLDQTIIGAGPLVFAYSGGTVTVTHGAAANQLLFTYAPASQGGDVVEYPANDPTFRTFSGGAVAAFRLVVE